ncbi:hypothetical protein [Sorangium sp. So ce385]|uniref:hypothetical protein n=1 Tax=Sorangium sp. So ce385 TaxID=3133308 RepID=UPI003F5C15E7
MRKEEPQAGRLPRPTERPLDDGVRYGPETWREIDGVAFCHWDRWLLRLALAEPRGLDAIEREFRTRAASGRVGGDAAEAMRAQVVDLRGRLARLARTPEGVILRDLLELAVWEDYGVLRGVRGFLGALQEEHADLAVRELAAILSELRRERLDYQVARAVMLRRAVLAPWG